MTIDDNADILILNLKIEGGEGMKTSLMIKCPSCGWSNFDIERQQEDEGTSTVYLDAKCDRCYLPISGVISPGEIRFNYEKRTND